MKSSIWFHVFSVLLAAVIATCMLWVGRHWSDDSVHCAVCGQPAEYRRTIPEYKTKSRCPTCGADELITFSEGNVYQCRAGHETRVVGGKAEVLDDRTADERFLWSEVLALKQKVGILTGELKTTGTLLYVDGTSTISEPVGENGEVVAVESR